MAKQEATINTVDEVAAMIADAGEGIGGDVVEFVDRLLPLVLRDSPIRIEPVGRSRVWVTVSSARRVVDGSERLYGTVRTIAARTAVVACGSAPQLYGAAEEQVVHTSHAGQVLARWSNTPGEVWVEFRAVR